ncbi:MAG: DUF1844 domain-containing protein [Phycisphaerae bacterium]|nr:DUF1844 domain-containing protein [Phycisphaerae bacterium]
MTDEKKKPEPNAGANKTPTGESRIHVDADWKKQAQAEKERLAREVETKGPAAGGAAGAGRPGRIPEATFSTLVQTLATQAAILMSSERDPRTGRTLQNLDLAKHHVDLLGVLEEKTKGNLSDEEKQLLDTLLYELQMAYVSAAS